MAENAVVIAVVSVMNGDNDHRFGVIFAITDVMLEITRY